MYRKEAMKTKRFFISFLLGVIAFIVTLFPNVILLFFPNLLKASWLYILGFSAFWGIVIFIIMYVVLGDGKKS